METVKRWILSIPGAVLVTILLFLLMIVLIKTANVRLGKKEDYVQIQINPAVEEYKPTGRETKIDKVKKVKPPPPPPKIQKPKADKPTEDLGQALAGDIPPMEKPEIKPTEIGTIVIDEQEEAPLVRIPPIYPIRAAERGIEGECDVLFDINENGVPFNIRPTCTNSIFIYAVKKAVQKWKYQPRIRGGKKVVRTNWKTHIPFRLEE